MKCKAAIGAEVMRKMNGSMTAVVPSGASDALTIEPYRPPSQGAAYLCGALCVLALVVCGIGLTPLGPSWLIAVGLPGALASGFAGLVLDSAWRADAEKYVAQYVSGQLSPRSDADILQELRKGTLDQATRDAATAHLSGNRPTLPDSAMESILSLWRP